MSANGSSFFGMVSGAGYVPEKSEDRPSVYCPRCEQTRWGETGEEFKGELICVSCLEGLCEE